ncbi:hypothetical protein H6P81_015554 [Aristolochia fimbriata]|uniref:Uncharacterized protein n=1 Tax=Aristolochia fimbriata TaxID=158543 RepID=A0AAV7E626_ARIFI|nr:hypothetical protein H6P81_015554 [Aristolochia fimbriata]
MKVGQGPRVQKGPPRIQKRSPRKQACRPRRKVGPIARLNLFHTCAKAEASRDTREGTRKKIRFLIDRGREKTPKSQMSQSSCSDLSWIEKAESSVVCTGNTSTCDAFAEVIDRETSMADKDSARP